MLIVKPPRSLAFLHAQGGLAGVLLAVMLVLVGVGWPSLSRAQAPSDWVQAVSLMQAQNPSAALPYLERLVRDYPHIATYRLELGYALYQLEQDGRARYHIEQARGKQLDSAEARVAGQLLDDISRRKNWAIRFGFGIEPSSNAGKGTLASTINVGDLVLSIPEELRSKPATGAILSFGVTVLPELSDNVRGVLSFDTLIRHYQDKTLRELVGVGRAGLRYYSAPNTYVDGGVLVGREYVAGALHSDRTGVYAAFSRPIGARAFARFQAEYSRYSYDSFTMANGARALIAGELSYTISPQTMLRGSAFILRTNAQSALQSGWKGQMALGLSHAFKGGLVAVVDLTAGMERRDGTGALTGVARQDKSLALEAEFFNSNYKIGRFLPVLKIKAERNRSNITLNGYSNRSLTLGIRSVF